MTKSAAFRQRVIDLVREKYAGISLFNICTSLKEEHGLSIAHPLLRRWMSEEHLPRCYPGRRPLPTDLIDRIVQIVNEHCQDCTLETTSNFLKYYANISVSITTLGTILVSAGVKMPNAHAKLTKSLAKKQKILSIIQLRCMNFKLRDIVTLLREEYGISISHESIRNYLIDAGYRKPGFREGWVDKDVA